MTENNHLIYKISSPSEKCYIGQTMNLKQRITNHKNKRSSCIYISNAIQKYGWKNMTLEVLHENLSLDDANLLEQLEIQNNNSLSPNGYNMLTGGANSLHSDETKAKIGAANKGKKRSEEHCKRMSEINTGKTISPESIAKSVAKNTGKKRTQEFKDLMSKIHKGRYISPEQIEKARITKLANGKKPSKESIEKTTISNFKLQFEKEFKVYSSKIHDLEDDISFTAKALSVWLDINVKTVIKKLKDNLFPNVKKVPGKRNTLEFKITKRDLVDYYDSMNVKLFGEESV